MNIKLPHLNETKILILIIMLSTMLATPVKTALAGNAKTQTLADPFDYSVLSHDVDVSLLRAGTHNGEKPGSYFFKITAYGLINSPEEKSKELSKRKKVITELGAFGESLLEPLAIWRADTKAKEFKQIHIDGKAIRELVAKSMAELQIPESEVTIQTDVSLVVKRKKYYLLNDDLVVATVSFSPLAQFSPDKPPADQVFTMSDDKGTVAQLTMRYTGGSILKASDKK